MASDSAKKSNEGMLRGGLVLLLLLMAFGFFAVLKTAFDPVGRHIKFARDLHRSALEITSHPK